MQRNSRLWWASILLSSVVTGGGSFAILTLFTELPIETVVKLSVLLIIAGDIALAFLMQSVSPTRVKLGPGERRHRDELPTELGTVIADFENRRGCVSIRGERWRARQTNRCGEPLEAGSAVRVIEREGLTLLVTAAETQTRI